MIGKIDQYGNLSIKRAGTWKEQKCDNLSTCNDDCPLFDDTGPTLLFLQCSQSILNPIQIESDERPQGDD